MHYVSVTVVSIHKFGPAKEKEKLGHSHRNLAGKRSDLIIILLICQMTSLQGQLSLPLLNILQHILLHCQPSPPHCINSFSQNKSPLSPCCISIRRCIEYSML